MFFKPIVLTDRQAHIIIALWMGLGTLGIVGGAVLAFLLK